MTLRLTLSEHEILDGGKKWNIENFVMRKKEEGFSIVLPNMKRWQVMSALWEKETKQWYCCYCEDYIIS